MGTSQAPPPSARHKGSTQESTGHVEIGARNRLNGLPRLDGAKKPRQFDDIPRKMIGGRGIAPQGDRRLAIRAWSTTKSKVCASGIKRFKGAEFRGDHHRQMVREPDSARADPDS
jgi:hypothetical protein